MQTAMHPAFAAKLAVLAVLLERSKSVRAEARAKASPRFQAASNGKTWDVVEIATGVVHGFAFTYQAAITFVSAMETGAASKTDWSLLVDSKHQIPKLLSFSLG